MVKSLWNDVHDLFLRIEENINNFYALIAKHKP